MVSNIAVDFHYVEECSFYDDWCLNTAKDVLLENFADFFPKGDISARKILQQDLSGSSELYSSVLQIAANCMANNQGNEQSQEYELHLMYIHTLLNAHFRVCYDIIQLFLGRAAGNMESYD